MHSMKRIIPDILVFCGLSSAGYGLWLWEPWVSYTVIGSVVALLGALIGRGED